MAVKNTHHDKASAAHMPKDHTNCITGAWLLDSARSDTLEAYMLCLGAPEHAIRAQVAAEQAYQSRNVIALDHTRLVIHKDTALNCYTESFKIDEEKISRYIPTRGVTQTSASLADPDRLDGYVIATTASSSSPVVTSAETVEARQLLDGGLVHVQELNVTNLVTGKECVVTRYWVRTPMTQADQTRLLAEA